MAYYGEPMIGINVPDVSQWQVPGLGGNRLMSPGQALQWQEQTQQGLNDQWRQLQHHVNTADPNNKRQQSALQRMIQQGAQYGISPAY